MATETKLEVLPGQHLEDAAEAAINVAKNTGHEATLTFNGVDLVVYPTSTPREIFWQYQFFANVSPA